MLLALAFAATLVQAGNDALVPVSRSDPWWTHRHEAVVLRSAMGNSDLVFIGDSITHAFGGEPYTGEDFGKRGEDTWDLFYGDRNAVNLGFSGDRTQHVLWRLDHGEMDGVHPKAVVIMIGTNNMGSNSADQIAEGVEAVCERAQSKAPNAKELLLAIFPRNEAASPTRAKVAETNKLLASWAGPHHVAFLDIGSVFLDEKGEIPKDIMPDALHPTAFGYRKWAMAMEPILARLMGQGPKTTDDPMNTTMVPVTQNRDQMNDWMPRHEQILREIHDQGDTQMVFIGDSITQGWVGVGRPVWDEFYGPHKPLNEGYGWDRIENVLWRIQQGELDTIRPRSIVLLIGTNNIGINSGKEIETGIRAVLRDIHEKQPKAHVLLLGILPRSEKADDPDRAKVHDVNVLLARMPKPAWVRYVEVWNELLNPDGSISPDVMADFLHPTEKGYRIIANAIEPALRQWMGR